jgi:hypothetical protein
MNAYKTGPGNSPAACGDRSGLLPSTPPVPRKDMTLTESTASRPRRPAAPHRPQQTGSGGRPAVALLLRLGCVALLAWIGYIHLHLWQEGYRQIPTNGPLFLLDAMAGFILASVLLAWPRPLAGLLAVGYTASTLGALIISLTVGLFGFRESISASYVAQSLTIETITVLALLTWTALAARPPQPATRARNHSLSQASPTKVREQSAEGNRAH